MKNAGHAQAGTAGLVGIALSRSLLERALRNRTLALHGVRLLDDTDVIEVPATPPNWSWTRRAGGLRTPSWLAQWGCEPPVESRTTVDTTYVTRSCRRGPHHLDGRPGRFSGATRAQTAVIEEPCT